MTTYMHCRPFCGNNISICSTSFHCLGSGSLQTPNYRTHIPTSYHCHDQAPPPATMATALLTSPPRRRRRLEDPIITYASNYYSTLPHPISQGLPAPPPPPPPPPRRIYQSVDRNVYCDLFNLLERSSPPPPPVTKQRRKYHFNDFSSRRHHRAMDFDHIHTKSKKSTERKYHHHHHHQQSCYLKEKKRHDDKLPSTEQYDRSANQTKQINDVYQRRSPNKGFFRRVVRNYFCMPSTFANNGYSS